MTVRRTGPEAEKLTMLLLSLDLDRLGGGGGGTSFYKSHFFISGSQNRSELPA